MSILYCSIVSRNEKLALAESTKGISFSIRVNKALSDIDKKPVSDVIELDGDKTLYYIKTKPIVFVLISEKATDDEKCKRFLELLVDIVIRDFKSFENVIMTYHPTEKLCKGYHQKKLEVKFNDLVNLFDIKLYDNTKIKSIDSDLDSIKINLRKGLQSALKNNEDLEELLIKAENIENKANLYEVQAKQVNNATKTCCCLSRAVFITLLVIVGLIAAWIITSVIRCQSLIVIWCK